MRYLFLVLLHVIAISCHGQDSTFFIAPQKQLYWQKIFDYDKAFSELYFLIKTSGRFNSIDSSNNTIYGEVKKHELDYSNAKETIWKTEIPGYIKFNDFIATFEVSFKPGKYRVIIKNIKSVGKSENPKDNIFISQPNEEHTLEFWALKGKKAEFDKSFIKYSKPIFDFSFNKLVSFSQEVKSNW